MILNLSQTTMNSLQHQMFFSCFQYPISFQGIVKCSSQIRRASTVTNRSESFLVCFGWLVGFLTSSSTTRPYRRWVPRLRSDNFTIHETELGDHDLSQPVTFIIQTTIQPVGSGRPQQELYPGHPHQESSALLTELSHPP